MNPVVYCYPMWHQVSFALVARKHIEHLRRRASVYEVDISVPPHFAALERYTLLVHPFFSTVWRWHQMLHLAEPEPGRRLELLKDKLSSYGKVVGLEVADSDEVSQLAVKAAEVFTDVVVPSTFSRDALTRSGVKTPVHVVPHGVDRDWFYTPSPLDALESSPAFAAAIQSIIQLKRRGVKVLLFWLWHSPERKGWFEVVEFYERLRRERSDVVLIVKTLGPLLMPGWMSEEPGIINVFGWLTEREKMLLYDVADLTLLFSRGGAFELNGLESLARGTPAIAHRRGAWVDYMPPWLLVKEGARVKVFEDNAIHTGFGYAIDVEDALDKACTILDDPREWRARTLDYSINRLSREFTWDAAVESLSRLLP